MNIQDQIIRDTRSLLKNIPPVCFPYDSQNCAPARKDSQVLLLKETALSLEAERKKVRRTSASLQNRVSWEKIPLCFTARIWGR